MDKPYSLPYLMIVSGASGTGKTTLARRLSNHFAFPLVSKDMIKEELANALGCTNLAESVQLGRASIALMYRFAEVVLQTHHSCIIESVFHLAFAKQDLLNLQERCPFLPLQIHCRAEISVVVERLNHRLESGERHACHMDNLRILDLINHLEQEQLEFVPHPISLINGHLIELDTTNFEKIDHELLFSQIRNILSGP